MDELALRVILLDTNVVSEAIKPEPHLSVRNWLDTQAAESLFLSSITVAKLLYGIGALPAGKRKDMLAVRIDGLLAQFAARVLPFDTEAARRFADLAIKARTADMVSPHPMATSPLSPPRKVSLWHRATRVRLQRRG